MSIKLGTGLAIFSAVLASLSVPTLAQQNANATAAGTHQSAAKGDGQHDFDFHIGKWRSDISRLEHALAGSNTWITCQGTLVARKVWDGRAQLEELEADCPSGHIEDLLLFLYNPQTRQWSLNSAAVGDGVISRPMFGEFKNGRGEFYDQEPFKDRQILVRQVWSDITPTSHHFEQAFSADGGKTWETNFRANLTLEQ